MRFAAAKKTAVGIVCFLLCFCMLFSGCSRSAAPVPATGFAMGSLISVNVYTNEATANTIADTIFKEIAALEGRISATDETSEIAALNRGETVDLTPDTFDELRETLELCEMLRNRTDITLGSVTSLWGFSTDEPHKPADEEIAAALAAVGADRITFDGSKVTLAPGQKLDLGAVGKGEACDIARVILDTSYVVPAVVSFGGTVLCYGQKADGPWTVGIRDPFGTAQDVCAVYTFTPEDEMDFRIVSTSGGYEKNFTENGITYHHILDPDTGYPVENELAAVTAVGRYGRYCDALSTALYVNGLNEESRGWIDDFLIGAVFIFKDGGIWASEGLRDGFRLENTDRFYFTEYEP